MWAHVKYFHTELLLKITISSTLTHPSINRTMVIGSTAGKHQVRMWVGTACYGDPCFFNVENVGRFSLIIIPHTKYLERHTTFCVTSLKNKGISVWCNQHFIHSLQILTSTESMWTMCLTHIHTWLLYILFNNKEKT